MTPLSFIEYIGVKLLKLNESMSCDNGAIDQHASATTIVARVDMRKVSKCVESIKRETFDVIALVGVC